MPHPRRTKFDAITADGNPVADVADPVAAEAGISSEKMSVDSGESELNVGFVVAAVLSCCHSDLAERKRRVVCRVVLIETNPVARLRDRSIAVPVEFDLPLLAVTTGQTLGQRR